MSYFLVTYDLVHHASESDYESLLDELRRLGAQRAQDSVWLVDWDGTAAELFDHLQPHLHAKDDRLLVLQYFKNSTWKSDSFKGTNAWLTTRCGSSS